MKQRPEDLNHLPSPYYYQDEAAFTLVIHHGGVFSTRTPGYIGGEVTKYDHVNLTDIGFPYLDKLCEKLGYMGVKRYFKLESNGFVIFTESHHILQYCLSHDRNQDVSIYLEATLIELDNQVGGSNAGGSNVGGSNAGGSNAGGDEPIEECEDSDDSAECEDFSDSEYDFNSMDEDVSGDDILFENNVDIGAEWVGNIQDDNVAGNSDATEDVVASDSDDFESDNGSDEDEHRYPVFSVNDTFEPRLQLGMLFTSKSDFRGAIHSIAILTKRNLKITKNDKRRIYAKCGGTGCEWRCHALAIEHKNCFQIREYYSTHQCVPEYHVKNISSGWLGGKYKDSFKNDPRRNVKGWRLDVIKQLNVEVSTYQAYRAKWSALKQIEGSSEDQYKCLHDYAEELRTSNPGSTIILSIGTDGRFFRLYTCFKGLKDGFLAGCRPIIGVDGCHLKGSHGGVLLCAVGIDPNNCTFPISWAVVGSETKDSWEWFLTVLKYDLNIERDCEWTFMSDKQKGLIPAFDIVFPGAENRFCVRHLHGNMKRHGFRGQLLKKAFWKATRASTVAEFNTKMKELAEMDPKVVEWLNDKPPKHWSRSHFTCDPKCDILLNNLCESFNAKILEAREKNIFAMLEKIREFMLKRMQENRDMAARWKGRFCPKIRQLITINQERASDCIPTKSTNVLYGIDCYDGSKCKVDLSSHSCSCRKWDLSGIPCKHAMSAINNQKLNVEDFVHHCYSVETYRKVYRYCIFPINGPEKWKKTGLAPPLPPNTGRKAGRPSSARRLEPEEPPLKRKRRRRGRQEQDHKLRKQKAPIHCKYCGEEGHHIYRCKKKKDAEQQAEGGNQHKQDDTMNSQEKGNDGHVNNEQHLEGVDWGEGVDWEQISLEDILGSIEVDTTSTQVPIPAPTPQTTSTQVPTEGVTGKGKLTVRRGRKVTNSSNLTAQSNPQQTRKRQNQTNGKDKDRGKTKEKVPAQSLENKGKGPVVDTSKRPVVDKSKGPALGSNTKGKEPPLKPPTQGLSGHCSAPTSSTYVFGQVPTPYFGPSPNPPTSRSQPPNPPPCKVIEKDGKRFVTTKSLTSAVDKRKAEIVKWLMTKQNQKF